MQVLCYDRLGLPEDLARTEVSFERFMTEHDAPGCWEAEELGERDCDGGHAFCLFCGKRYRCVFVSHGRCTCDAFCDDVCPVHGSVTEGITLSSYTVSSTEGEERKAIAVRVTLTDGIYSIVGEPSSERSTSAFSWDSAWRHMRGFMETADIPESFWSNEKRDRVFCEMGWEGA